MPMDERLDPASGMASPQHVWRLLVKGFTLPELRLLQGVVMLSRRRLPHIQLVQDDQAETAEAVLIDGKDPQAMLWAQAQPWLRERAVIWVDAGPVPVGHLAVRRPVQWPTFPVLMSKALEHHGDLKPQDTPQRSGRTVLVVDDSPSIRTHLRLLLERDGLEVVEAPDALQGIAMAADPTVGCVLMDVLMPGIDGYEACKRIKAAQRGGGTPPAVVMLTSRASPFDRIRGKVAGCDAYLAKPVESGELLAVLARHLDGAGGAPADAANLPFSLRFNHP
jgi:twitching motility two-component system response regulator PilG